MLSLPQLLLQTIECDSRHRLWLQHVCPATTAASVVLTTAATAMLTSAATAVLTSAATAVLTTTASVVLTTASLDSVIAGVLPLATAGSDDAVQEYS
jgi:hypothetical protein